MSGQTVRGGADRESWVAGLEPEIVWRESAGRAMFASNFPVDSLCASFDTIFSGFHEIVADFTEAEQQALFHDNAVRIYGME